MAQQWEWSGSGPGFSLFCHQSVLVSSHVHFWWSVSPPDEPDKLGWTRAAAVSAAPEWCWKPGGNCSETPRRLVSNAHRGSTSRCRPGQQGGFRWHLPFTNGTRRTLWPHTGRGPPVTAVGESKVSLTCLSHQPSSSKKTTHGLGHFHDCRLHLLFLLKIF